MTPFDFPTLRRDDTLNALYETGVERLPERAMWDRPNESAAEANDRFVLIGEEVIEDTAFRAFGGCWPTVESAFESYDWNAGPPVFLVDLFAEPAKAVLHIKLTPSLADLSPTSVEDTIP